MFTVFPEVRAQEIPKCSDSEVSKFNCTTKINFTYQEKNKQKQKKQNVLSGSASFWIDALLISSRYPGTLTIL